MAVKNRQKVICEKHGDVTGVTLTMSIRREDGFVWESAQCLICVDEKLKELGVASPRIEDPK